MDHLALPTFVHAGLVEFFDKFKRLWFVWRTLLLDASSQLFLKRIHDDGERVHADFVIGNDGGLEEAAAGKFIKVITGLHIVIHVFQYLRGCGCCCRISTIQINKYLGDKST